MEVLLLQPQVVMVVVITSTGGVTKKIFPFVEAVDPKLVEWAGQFLNEQLSGIRVGTHALNQRLNEPGLGGREQAFWRRCVRRSPTSCGADEQMLYVGGAARLLDGMHYADVEEINALVRVLEERVSLLAMLRSALESERLYVRIGGENTVPHMRGLSMVAANYGLPTRNLGTVSLIGPMRMDYANAIRTVRGAAAALWDLVSDVYED